MATHRKPDPDEIAVSTAVTIESGRLMKLSGAATFTWHPCEPAAIRMRITTRSAGLPDAEVDWRMARRLVADALAFGEAGHGDVRISDDPEGGRVAFEFRSHEGTGTCVVPRGTVVDLLAGAEAIVPNGSPDEDELIRCALHAVLAEMFREDAGQ